MEIYSDRKSPIGTGYGPQEDRRRSQRYPQEHHPERTGLQVREFSRFHTLFLALRMQTGRMSNSVSYLQVPKRFTTSRGHAHRKKIMRGPSLPPLLPRTRVVPVQLRHREGLESDARGFNRLHHFLFLVLVTFQQRQKRRAVMTSA
jgi:hypothetical protein